MQFPPLEGGPGRAFSIPIVWSFSNFRIPSDRYAASVEEFIRRAHLDDRQQVSEALADARQNRRKYAAEFATSNPIPKRELLHTSARDRDLKREELNLGGSLAAIDS